MSNLKCPFCNKPLQPTHRSENEYWCENYDCTETSWKFGSISLWQELIRTRKALDVAVDALNAGKTLADIAGFKMLVAGLEEALNKITALEQKN